MIRYKIDVLDELKRAGYSSYKLRADKIIGERQLQQIRSGEMVSIACLNKLCQILKCQPGDIMEYVEESE